MVPGWSRCKIRVAGATALANEVVTTTAAVAEVVVIVPPVKTTGGIEKTGVAIIALVHVYMAKKDRVAGAIGDANQGAFVIQGGGVPIERVVQIRVDAIVGDRPNGCTSADRWATITRANPRGNTAGENGRIVEQRALIHVGRDLEEAAAAGETGGNRSGSAARRPHRGQLAEPLKGKRLLGSWKEWPERPICLQVVGRLRSGCLTHLLHTARNQQRSKWR